MKESKRITTGFLYEGTKCIRKSQLIDWASRGGMYLTDFAYAASEKGIFPTQEELTTLTTLRKLKADAGHMMSSYNSAEHKDSELYLFNPGNVENQAPIECEESEEKDDETNSEECISINDVREGGDSSSGIGDNSEPRIPIDEDIAIRVQTGIAAAFSLTYDSLMMCLSWNNSRPLIQRRYINPEAASLYKRQHQILLTVT